MISRLQSSPASHSCLAVVTPSLTALVSDSWCREVFDALGGIGMYFTPRARARRISSGVVANSTNNSLSCCPNSGLVYGFSTITQVA
jgi:hypothetical protein